MVYTAAIERSDTPPPFQATIDANADLWPTLSDDDKIDIANDYFNTTQVPRLKAQKFNDADIEDVRNDFYQSYSLPVQKLKPVATPQGSDPFGFVGDSLGGFAEGISANTIEPKVDRGFSHGVGKFLGQGAGTLGMVGGATIAAALSGGTLAPLVPAALFGSGALYGGADELQRQKLSGQQPDWGKAAASGALQGGLNMIPAVGQTLKLPAKVALNAAAQGVGGGIGDVGLQKIQDPNAPIDWNRALQAMTLSGALGGGSELAPAVAMKLLQKKKPIVQKTLDVSPLPVQHEQYGHAPVRQLDARIEASPAESIQGQATAVEPNRRRPGQGIEPGRMEGSDPESQGSRDYHRAEPQPGSVRRAPQPENLPAYDEEVRLQAMEQGSRVPQGEYVGRGDGDTARPQQGRATASGPEGDSGTASQAETVRAAGKADKPETLKAFTRQLKEQGFPPESFDEVRAYVLKQDKETFQAEFDALEPMERIAWCNMLKGVVKNG